MSSLGAPSLMFNGSADCLVTLSLSLAIVNQQLGSTFSFPPTQYLVSLQHDRVLWKYRYVFKGTVSRDFLLLVFFYKSVSPQPQSIPLGPFRIFSKIRGDIRKSRCTTGVNDVTTPFLAETILY